MNLLLYFSVNSQSEIFAIIAGISKNLDSFDLWLQSPEILAIL